MNSNSFQSGAFVQPRTHEAIVEPDFKGFDSAENILRDAAKWGLLEELRKLLNPENRESAETGGTPEIIRDIGYELAGAKNRDFAVDLFIHVTGITEFGPASLRDYARKYGCSHEWFRKEAEAMRKRLGLAPLTVQRR